MNAWLLSAIALCYAGVAVQMFFKGAWPEALMFTGWAIGGGGSVLLAMRVG